MNKHLNHRVGLYFVNNTGLFSFQTLRKFECWELHDNCQRIAWTIYGQEQRLYSDGNQCTSFASLKKNDASQLLYWTQFIIALMSTDVQPDKNNESW